MPGKVEPFRDEGGRYCRTIRPLPSEHSPMHSRPVSSNHRHVSFEACYFLFVLILSIALTVLFYVSNDDLFKNFSNSDALYVPALFEDLFVKGGSIGQWYFAAPNYLFPDHALYALAYLLGDDLYSRLCVFSAAQVVTTCAVILFLLKQVAATRHALVLAATTTFLLAWLGSSAYYPFMHFFTIGHHYGAVLVSVLNIGLWLRYQRQFTNRDKGRTATVGLILLVCFVGAFSDPLFLIQGVLPLAMVVLASSLVFREFARTRGALLSLLVIVSGGLGYYFYPLLVQYTSSTGSHIGFDRIEANVFELSSLLAGVIMQSPPYLFLGLAFLSAVCMALHQATRRVLDIRTRPGRSTVNEVACAPWSSTAPGSRTILSIYAALSVGSCLCFSVLLESYPVQIRYLWPCFFWPIVVAATILLRHERLLVGVCGLIAVLPAVVFLIHDFPDARATIRDRFYPSEIACIDRALSEAGARHGIAGYWDARRLQSWSSLELEVAQYDHGLNRFRHATSEAYFRDTYDFALLSDDGYLTDDLHHGVLVRINGKPDREVRCGDKTLLVYRENGLRTELFVSPGNRITWAACDLPTEIGRCDAESGDVQAPGAVSGFLTYGPYIALPAGTYRLDFTYASSAPVDTVVGRWDAGYFDSENVQILADGGIHGTGGARSAHRGTFEVTDRADGGRVETRVFKLPHLNLRVHELTIEKLR